MNYNINKADYQLIQMYLSIVISEAERLTTGNVSHNAVSIKNHAKKIKNMLGKAQQTECPSCKHTEAKPEHRCK